MNRTNKAQLVVYAASSVLACSGANDSPEGTTVGQRAAGLEVSGLVAFETPDDWLLGPGADSSAAAMSSRGEQALKVRGSGAFWLESRPFGVDGPPARVGLDVLLPDDRVSWSGTMRVALECGALEIFDEEVGRVELSTITTGRFETVSLPLGPALKDRLQSGCPDLVVRIDFSSSGGELSVLLDRLELDYAVGAVPSRLCGVSEIPYDPSEELPNGYLRRHSWRSGVAAHFEIARIQEALAKEPEIIGFTADDAERRFIVVVDPEKTEDLDELAAQWSKLRPIVPLTVQPACHGGSELEHALAVIEGGTFHPLASESELIYGLDPAGGRYDVLVEPEHREVGEALEHALGDLVTVQYREYGEHGRFDDGLPHYGAAAVTSFSSENCTGGFPVDNGSERGAVIAGHCAAYLGEEFFSGPYLWGEAAAFPGSSAWDMAYIGPAAAGETWSARIHTDPCCPANRPVTAKSPPYVSQLVCISGRNFLAKCSVEVIKMDSTRPIDGVVRSNVWEGRRAGVNIGAPGDSGAPLYVPVGYGNAAIVGMHIGGWNDAPHDETWFHSVTDIEAQLGVSVAYW